MRNMKFWRTALVAALVLTVMLSVTGGRLLGSRMRLSLGKTSLRLAIWTSK